MAGIDPQEAVARIKDKHVVTLTMLRGLPKPAHLNQAKLDLEHIYDDMSCSQDENLPSTAISTLAARKHQCPKMQSCDMIENLPAFERSTYKGHMNYRMKQDRARKHMFENAKRVSSGSNTSTTAMQRVARKKCWIEGEYEVEVCDIKQNSFNVKPFNVHSVVN